jgi:hypothetical protein
MGKCKLGVLKPLTWKTCQAWSPPPTTSATMPAILLAPRTAIAVAAVPPKIWDHVPAAPRTVTPVLQTKDITQWLRERVHTDTLVKNGISSLAVLCPCMPCSGHQEPWFADLATVTKSGDGLLLLCPQHILALPASSMHMHKHKQLSLKPLSPAGACDPHPCGVGNTRRQRH